MLLSVRLLGGPAAGLLMAACSGASSDIGTTSAGIWSLASPSAVIGGTERRGGVEFTAVLQVLPIGEDTAVVVDGRIYKLLIFNSSGQLIDSIGREGDGPGEFRGAVRIGLRGDTLWVGDGRRRIRSFFSRGGRFHRSEPLVPLMLGWDALGRAIPTRRTAGFLSNGHTAAVGKVSLPPDSVPAPQPRGSVGLLMLFDTTGTARETLAFIPAHSLGFDINLGRGTFLLGATQFSDAPLWTSADDGELVLLVDRRNTEVQGMNTYKVIGWDAQGRRRFAEPVPYDPVPVSSATVDSLVDFWGRDMLLSDSSLALSFTTALVRDSLKAPAHYPPVSDVFVGADGRIWIGREGLLGRMHALPTGYDVLTPDGKLIGRIKLERPARIIAASRDAAWIVDYDQNDVPVLSRHPIRR
jgi:hypothetical protein